MVELDYKKMSKLMSIVMSSKVMLGLWEAVEDQCKCNQELKELHLALVQSATLASIEATMLNFDKIKYILESIESEINK
jgi:hypothetical protein